MDERRVTQPVLCVQFKEEQMKTQRKGIGEICRIGFTLTICLLLIAVLSGPAPAQVYADSGTIDNTYTVNTDADTDDGTCDEDHCTLREAINAANASLTVYIDLINFDMPYLDTVYPVIAPTTPLPKITDSVLIDGSTQEPWQQASLSGANGVEWGLAIDGAATGVKIQDMLISGFDGPGIVAEGGLHGMENNLLMQNEYGIYLTNCDGNYIGHNVILQNEKDGIAIVRDDSQANNITQNSIYDNGELGIDLGDDGVTSNDVEAKDADTGPNDLQNYPILTRVANNYARGYLYSRPETGFRIECFGNETLDPTGYGEGRTYLGETYVTTDEQGEAFFDVNLTEGNGVSVACTAYGAPGGTSEFSSVLNELIVNSGGDAPDEAPGSGGCDTGDTVTIGGTEYPECTLRAAIQEANFTSRPDKITFRWDPTPLTINTTSPLPPIEEMTDINGRTRPNGVIVVGEGFHFTVDHSSLRGIEVNGAAGVGVEADGSLYLEDVRIRDCAQEGVKAVGDVTISGENAATNEILDNGGTGLFTQDGKVFVEDILIEGSGGWGIDAGGAVHITPPDQYGYEVKFQFNQAGGVRSRNDDVWATSVTVQNNQGPGIWAGKEVNVAAEPDSTLDTIVKVYNNSGVGIRGNKGVRFVGTVTIEVIGNGRSNEAPGIFTLEGGFYARSYFKVNANGGWGIDVAENVYLAPGSTFSGGVTGETSTVNENANGGVRSRYGKHVVIGSRESPSNDELYGDPVAVKDNDGAGVWASVATVDITGSDISNNVWIGIRSGGDVHLHGSDNRVNGNGMAGGWPGIYTEEGEVTADLITANGNDGWGIDAAGSVSIDATTQWGDSFSGRSQVSNNGAMSGRYLGNRDGGGIRSRNGDILVRQADVTHNAGGRPGIWAQQGHVELRDVNVSNNRWGGVEALTGLQIVGGSNQVNENGEADEDAGIKVSHGDVTIAAYVEVSHNLGWGTTISGTVEMMRLKQVNTITDKPCIFANNGSGGLQVDVDNEEKGLIMADYVALINNGGDGLQTNGVETEIASGVVMSNAGYGIIFRGGALYLGATAVRSNDQGGIQFEPRSGGTRQVFDAQEMTAEDERAFIYQSTIVENGGDGLRYAGGGPAPVISRTNLFGNTGYGVNNTASGITLEAQGNWWGDAAGPGAGDTSGSVNTADWRTEPVSIVVAAQPATVFAGRAATTTVPVYVHNWSEPTGEVTMTLADTQGWLADAAISTVALTETGVIVPVRVAVPGDAALDTGDLVTVIVTSQADPSVAERDTFQVRVAEVADLSLTKTTPGRVHAGAPFTVTLVVANAGPDDATGVIVTDTLPSSATFVSSEDCTSLAGGFRCEVGGLASSAQVTATALLVATGEGVLHNRAEVAGAEYDPDSLYNVDRSSTLVKALRPLVAAPIEGPTLGEPDTTYTFTTTAAPLTATLPLTYTWEATGQDDWIIVRYAYSETVHFNWADSGRKMVTVTVANEAGDAVVTTHLLAIKQYLYLPLVLRVAGESANDRCRHTSPVSPFMTDHPRRER